MQIRKIYNANVYLAGTNSLLGRAKEVALPELVVNMDAHRGLGQIGDIELPTGLAALVTKIKWAGWYPEQLENANPFAATQLQVRANTQVFGAGGLEQEQALVVLLTVTWKKSPLGTISAGTAGEPEDELATTYVKVTLGGEELLELDVHANIWRVKGVDVLAQYRANLGG